MDFCQKIETFPLSGWLKTIEKLSFSEKKYPQIVPPDT